MRWINYCVTQRLEHVFEYHQDLNKNSRLFKKKAVYPHYLFLYQNHPPHVAADKIIQKIIILFHDLLAGLFLRFGVYKKEGVNAINNTNQMTIIEA
jgi:hypothetical protein